MANLTVGLVVVLAVLVDVGLCRFAGGGSTHLSGAFGQHGPGEEKSSALKDVLSDLKSGEGNHGTKKGYTYVGKDDKHGDSGYITETQGTDGDSKEHNTSDDDINHINEFMSHESFNEEHRNKLSTDVNVSYIPPEKFITAGGPTGLGQYPWVVHLDVLGYTCGGSLISYRHVITAAHCLDFQIRSYEQVKIYLGEYNTRTFPTDCVGTQCIQNFMVNPDKISIHPRYQTRIFHNDIAMMRLRRPAPNYGYIRPIPLPTFNINDPRYEGTPLTITGWGKTENGRPSSIKLHARVQLVAPNTCRQRHPVTQGMLCAASRNGQDMCYGDSGGPIMVENGGNYLLVGLVSFRTSRCGSSIPSMYTNVYSYLNWIHNFMRS